MTRALFLVVLWACAVLLGACSIGGPIDAASENTRPEDRTVIFCDPECYGRVWQNNALTVFGNGTLAGGVLFTSLALDPGRYRIDLKNCIYSEGHAKISWINVNLTMAPGEIFDVSVKSGPKTGCVSYHFVNRTTGKTIFIDEPFR